MKAAYKWVLNNNVSAYIVSESEAAPFLYYIKDGKRVYENSEIVGTQINEEAISLTVNNIKTTEDYDNLYNRLKDLVEAKERIILPSDSSQFYSIDGLGCKRNNVGISVEIESVEDGPLGVTAVTEGVASMQKIKFDFTIPIGQRGKMGDYRKVSSARDYIDDSAESGVTASIKENGEYDLSFILHNGAQGDKGPQGVRGGIGQAGFPFYVNPKGHTGNETGVQQWLENVGASDQRYALDFSLKRGTQGNLGEDAGEGEAPINCKYYDDGVVHEEKIYIVSDYNAANVTKPTVMYFGDVLIYPEPANVKQLDYTDLSLIDIYGNQLTLRETANTYVIRNTGLYEIPLIYGCAIKDGKFNPSSYTRISGSTTQPFYNYKNTEITSPLIEIDTNTEAESVEVMFLDATGYTIEDFAIVNKYFNVEGAKTCKYLRFNVKTIPPLGGNATIAVKDGNGDVMWSWQLWAYPFDLYEQHLITIQDNINVFALNVNLGFVKESENSNFGTSPQYQWGRKDPMKRDGAPSSGETGTSFAKLARMAGVQNLVGVSEAIQKPKTFFWKSIGDNGNWWRDKDGNEVNFYNYWNANNNSNGYIYRNVVKTIYDPSPVGFHVPCIYDFHGLSGQTLPFSRGIIYNNIYFTAEGYRDASDSSASGNTVFCGSLITYWSADNYSNSRGYYTYCNSSGKPYPNSVEARAYAMPIRPVREVISVEEGEEEQYDDEIISENSESIEFDTEEPIISENITLGTIIPEGTEVENQQQEEEVQEEFE